MLLSVSIITLLAGLSVPVYTTFMSRNDLEVTRQGIVESLRRAQTYARAVKDDSTWGVAVVSGKAVLFKGASYATRDAAFDENIIISSAITTSGLNEVVFAKLSGAPATTGTTTLTQSSTNTSQTVTINAKGMVQ